MKKLFVYLKGYGRECVLGPLFKLLEASFELIIPLLVASIIDRGILRSDTGHIVRMVLLMALLGLIGLACAVTAQYFAAKTAIGFSSRLRHALMAHIQTLSYTELDTIGSSTLITRMTSDVNQVQSGTNMGLRLLLRSPFVVFGAMVMAFTIDTQAALVFAGVIPVLCVVVFGIMLITMPMYKRVQSSLDRVTSATRQNLAGARVLRAFTMEKAETESFAEVTQELTRKQLSAGRISALLNPLTFVIVNLAVIVLIRVGALKVYEGVLTQGLVVALYNYMTQILVELIKMANLIITITKAVACGNRVQSVLEIPPEENAQGDGNIRGEVEFKNVPAKYEEAGEASLENISFRALPGETVGVIGGTGSGKTTLINLIPGFYSPAGGSVLLDGRDVQTYNRGRLRRSIGVVPQKAVLFQGTIRENLSWGKKDATEEELWQALEIAQAADVVRDKAGGLDARVEQGGTNFSGGQRQRLTIARALVRKPAVLILDDSASALDYATDANLRMAIRKMENPPTTFIVSQRAASVRYADRILVLDDGILAGIGTHDELLKTCPVYQEIYYSQFSREVTRNG